MKNRIIKNISHFGITLVLMAVLVVSDVYAQPEPNVFDGGNLWSITFYDDDSSNHQGGGTTQRICFSNYNLTGTGIQGRWYSTTYPNWYGQYRQEGDSVVMTGNFWNGDGNACISFDLVTMSPKDIGAGHGTEWNDSYSLATFFGNTLLNRLGKCPCENTDTENSDHIKEYLLEFEDEAKEKTPVQMSPIENDLGLEKKFK